MNKKTLLPILGGVLVLGIFVSRIVLRSMRHKEQAPTERVEPGASIEGFDDRTIKKGESKTIHIVPKGVRCSDLKISASGLNLRNMNSKDCTCEISGDKVGNAVIKVYGGGKGLLDSIPVTIVD